jgi:PAS domain S-box-containing protein
MAHLKTKYQKVKLLILLLNLFSNRFLRLKTLIKYCIPFFIVLLSISAGSQTLNLDSVLTESEIKWLNNNRENIRFAPNPTWPPGDYVENGIHKGFVADYIRLFEEMLGIDFIKVHYQNWTEILNGLQNSEVDFVGAIQKTEDRENYLLFSEPYKRIELGIVTKANYHHRLTNEHINSMSLACIKDYTSTQFVRKEYPDAQIEIVNDDLEALLHTSFGITDGAVIDLMTASFLVEKYGVSNLKTDAILDFHWDLRFASRDELIELNSIINKLLKNISPAQQQAFFNKWVNIEFNTEPGFFEKNYKIIIGVALIILFLLITLFIFNYSLKKQIDKRTHQLKKAKEFAKHNEEKYKLIAENTTDVVWLADLNFNTTYISPSVEKMFGGKVSDHLNKTLEERFPLHSIEEIKTVFQKEFEKEKQPDTDKNRSLTLVLEHFCTDGSTIWVEMNITFIRDNTGKPIGFHGITRNVTETKKAKDFIESRLAMEKLLSRISEIAIGNFEIDVVFNKILKKTGLTMNVSRIYIFEYENKSDTVSNTFEWCANGIEPQIQNLQSLPCDETPWFFDKLKQGKIIKYKNIERIPDESTKNILRFQNIISIFVVPLILNNRFYGFIGFDECKVAKSWHVEDVKVLQSLAYIVTSLIERKKTERELRIKDRSIELSLTAKAIADNEGKITYVNQTFLKYWKYQKLEEIIGKTVFEFWKSDDDSRIVVDAVRKKSSWQGELKAIRSDGTFFDALVQASLITSKDGAPLCMQASFYDITERKKWEQDLINAKVKAEESERLKSAFLANMSHEIRTPMNGILGFTDLLLEPDLSSDEKENFIKIVHQSGQRMLNTVNDIVEISKIEAGVIHVTEEETDINESVKELVYFFKSEAVKKKLELIVDKLLPITKKNITIDRTKFDSILTNLIKNAIKFTNVGKISVGCQSKDSVVEFYVKDTGIGIPNDKQEVIFDRFMQADIHDKRVFEGSGLGLAIAKSYVEMLGGKIWLQSEEGVGSTFRFTLPAKNSNKEKSDEHTKLSSDYKSKKSGFRKLKVLIADDDEISRKLIRLIVEDFGGEILEAKTGIETVELCRTKKDIDLILMDIKMPGLDGYEATRRIREFNKEVIIISQTAYGLSGDREKSIESGCNDYISKPVNRNKLQAMIQKYFWGKFTETVNN